MTTLAPTPSGQTVSSKIRKIAQALSNSDVSLFMTLRHLSALPLSKKESGLTEDEKAAVESYSKFADFSKFASDFYSKTRDD